MTRRIAVIGSGKRVREVALPAILRLEDRFTLHDVWSRTPKRLDVAGRAIEVAPLAELKTSDLHRVDLLYLSVAKDAIPAVLRRLTSLGLGEIDLLIDTPVVRFKHFRHAARCRAFRNAWVAEDCVELPWIQAVLAAVGPLREVAFDRSAYAYHGVATAKALLGARSVRSARRRSIGGGTAVRTLHLAGGGTARIVEPRDYAVGRMVFSGLGGSVCDRPEAGEAHVPLEVELEAGGVRALRAGEARIVLDDVEHDLTRGDPDDACVTARMEAMKRVGFVRLLRRIADKGRGYALDQALEDTVVDWCLERTGAYLSTPLSSPHSVLGRALLSTLTLPGGG